MRRVLIFLLSFVTLAVPTTSREASTSTNLAINVTAGQAITGVSLSSSTFTGGMPSGTVVAAISVTMSPSSPAFSGTLSLTGTNASQFQIVGGNLATNGVVTAGTYQVNIVATETGLTGSPFKQAETITGSSASSTPEKPGPSLALYNSNPYYTCSTNYYVSASASGSGNGTSGSPWTLDQAAAANKGAGSCINLSPGLYTIGGGIGPTTSGGNAATTTGYTVWRCTSMPFSFSAGVLQGEGSSSSCHIKNSGSNFYVFQVNSGVSYLMIDGLELDGSGIDSDCLDITAANLTHSASTTSDHIWIFNSDLHDCGLSGIQIIGQDWFFAIHNVWHDNSYIDGNMGSGLSDYEPIGRNGYTPTAQDNAWCSSTTGLCYHKVIAYNVGYHNYNPQNAPTTDGEGIILDDWGHTQNSCTGITGTCPYNGYALVMGNIMYYNGGGGLQAFSWINNGARATWVNNTTYNNAWDTHNTGTWRANNLLNAAYNTIQINNIAYAIGNAPGPPVTPTQPFLGDGDSGTTGNVWQTNLAYPANLNSFGAGNSYPTIGTNHNLDGSNPLFMSVTPGSTSNNFALQSGSPAIGFGQPFDLWQQSGSVDAGACVSSLTTCP